jgi:hypothetical protein
LTFVATADNHGRLSFVQDVGYAIKGVILVAYDPDIKRRGSVSRVTYAAYPVTGPRPGKYIQFYPNRRHYRIEVTDLNEAERKKSRRSYEDDVRVAETTRDVLSMRGITVGQ